MNYVSNNFAAEPGKTTVKYKYTKTSNNWNWIQINYRDGSSQRIDTSAGGQVEGEYHSSNTSGINNVWILDTSPGINVYYMIFE